MSDPASPEAIAAFLRAAGLDLDDEPIPTEALIRQVAGICRKLEDELGRGDYANARASLNRLIAIYPALNDPIDFATDPAVRDPLIDIYEAASLLPAARRRAAGRTISQSQGVAP